ncbi:MAG: CvpA family protein [Bacteroidales bacterium]|nr:CvpA family protein [Candidatus Cryptobacteroides aphodequi]
MAILDIILLCLFIPAIVRGLSKGFIEQVIALVSIVAGGYIAYTFAGQVQVWLTSHVHFGENFAVNDTVLYIICFVLVVAVCVILLNLVSKLFTSLLDKLSLGWINRLAGLVFGVFNTALVIGLVFSVFNNLNGQFFHLRTQWMEDSEIYHWIEWLCNAIFPFITNVFTQI